MEAWVVCFVAGLIASLSATEMVRVAAVKLSAVDQPGGRRAHHRPTPRLGGLGIVWGFGVALAFVAWGGERWGALAGGGAELLALLAGAALLAGIGLADDRRGLPWAVKLAASVVAAMALYLGGWRVETIGIPGLGSVATGVLGTPILVLWVALVTNAINLIDGLDGLATGVAVVACVALLVMPGSATMDRAVALALAGALLGFLWFNLHPALIFMGDAGSLFVGFVLAALTLKTGQGTPGAFPLVPMLVVAVPLADTCYAVARRAWAGLLAARSKRMVVREVARRVFAPDRGHMHHRLLEAGLSHGHSAALLWTAAASFALAGWVTATWSLLGSLLAVVAALVWLGVGRRLAQRIRVRQAVRGSSASDAVAIADGKPAEPSTDADESRPARAA